MTCSLDGVYTHAVLVVGYEFDAARVERSASETSASILAGVTALIVQDDRYGPYVRMTNLESTDHALGGDFLYGEGSRIKHHGMAETLVVPLPRGIGALGIDAHNIGVSFLELWTAKAQFTPRLDFCARTYLAESNTLKMEAQHWKWASAESLRKTSLPHWVWVTEALPLPLETDSLNATPIARVLSDPTVLRDAGDARLLWAHIGDDVLIPPPRPTRRPSSGAVERRRLIL